MSYCETCKTEIAGRFCSRCGVEAVSQGVTMETSVVTQGSAAAAGQPAPMRAPGYVAPVAGVPMQSMGATADNRFTHDAEFLLRSTGERIAWQGKPSILCLLPRVIIWSLVIFTSMVVAVSSQRGSGWVLFWLLMAAIHIGRGYLNWMHSTYRITSQRLEYSSGVFSATTAANPLSRIGNVTILRPFPWNFLHLGHLELDIPDEALRARNAGASRVRLKYLANLETTRDLIHSSSGILNQAWDRQRYGG